MAEDVVGHSAAVPRAEQPPLVEPRRETEPRVHRWRFVVAYVALALVAGATVGAAVVILDRPEELGEPAWSEWRPVGHQASFPDQIADFVGAAYLSPSGPPLTGVIATQPRVVNQSEFVPVQNLYIQNNSALPSASPDVDIVRVQDTVMYVLCGGGLQCSLAEGESPGTQLLLQRQALELALYTFRYVDGAGAVIVVLPLDLGQDVQSPADDTRLAVYLRKGEVERELARPLAATLGPTPAGGSALPENELQTVRRVTGPSLFQYQFEQVQTGDALMVLQPVGTRP